MAEADGVTQLVNEDKKLAKFEKQRQSWEKTRKRGSLSFILIRGVLGFGIPMIIVSACTDTFVDHKSLAFHPIRSLFWILAGWVMGLLAWDDGARRFHRATKQQDSSNEDHPE